MYTQTKKRALKIDSGYNVVAINENGYLSGFKARTLDFYKNFPDGSVP